MARIRLLAVGVALCAVLIGWSAGSALAQSGFFVTFAARVCSSYTQIFQNRAHNNLMESLKDVGEASPYGPSGGPVSPEVEDSGIQAACEPLPGWKFTLGTDYILRADTGAWGSMARVTGVFRATPPTEAETPLLDDNAEPTTRELAGARTIELTPEEAAQASERSRLWVQGGEPGDPVLAREFGTLDHPEYAFGALRCAEDNLNGDNVEYISFPTNVRHVFCYAFYVRPAPTSGTITIKKEVIGAPDGENPAFQFAGDINFGTAGFQLRNGQSMVFFRGGGVPWTVTEGAVADYATSVSCVTATGASTFAIAGSTATINLAPDDHATCTFTNRFVPPPSGLTITKITHGGVGSFTYVVTPVSGTGSHDVTATTTEQNVPVDAQPSLADLAPGTYRIHERLPTTPAGTWRAESVYCDGTSHPTNRPVEVTVRAGAGTDCIFTNAFTPRGSISIAKITEHATGETAFLVEPVTGTPVQYWQTATTKAPGVAADAVPATPADATDHLQLGTYRIIDQMAASHPPDAWTLTSVKCNGLLVPFAQGAAEVTLTAGEPAAHCVFTNTFSHKGEPTPEPQPDNDTNEPSVPQADLAVRKVALAAGVIRGQVIDYRVIVTNHGPDDAARVVLGDQPLGTATVVAVHTSVGSCQTSVPIICQFGGLRPGASVTVNIRLRVLTHAATLTNRAVVGSATQDPNLANNVDEARVHVVARVPAVKPPAFTG